MKDGMYEDIIFYTLKWSDSEFIFDDLQSTMG